jgi:hypothetical protein
MKFERSTVYGHGSAFTVFQTPEGYNISLNGRWVWRAKTKGEVNRVVRKEGLKAFQDNLSK